MALALVLVATLSITAVAGDKDPCVIGNVTHKVGDSNMDNEVKSGDITVTIKIIFGTVVDLEVTSDGCCNITVGAPVNDVVLAGETKTFYNIDKNAVVSVSADDSAADCAFDNWSDGGAQTHDITMDTDKCVTATCYTSYPEPCCWAIWATEYWIPPNAPPAAADLREYFCMHTEEILPGPGNHTEIIQPIPVGGPTEPFPVTVPLPLYQQELKAYEGAAPNGYTDTEWLEIAPTGVGIARTNALLGPITADGMGYWNSAVNRINMKTRYDVIHPLFGVLTIYSWNLAVIPYVGTPGFPYALGDLWVSITASHITTPTASANVIDDYQVIDCGGLIPPTGCYKVSAFQWEDADGVDDDLDGSFDEDPFNGWDDDADGSVDEDGGNMMPFDELDVMTPSGINWMSNQYTAPVKTDTLPGQLYDGTETRCLIWLCQDPPFPPWL